MKTKIKQIIADNTDSVHHSDVKETDYLKDDLGLNSLAKFYVALELEKEFNTTINDEVCESWQTVQDVINTIYEKQKSD